MKLNTQYVSNKNTKSGTMTPNYIVIHNTDNFKKGANALAHAKAQYNGNFSDMSCHWYVDDGDTAYQATPHNKGAWHVGKNYGGKLFGTVSNNNTVGIEMCVQSGYDYEKAFQNTVELCRHLMKVLGIDTAHVVQHWDVCGKNCPSQIRKNGDWVRFKKAISSSDNNPVSNGTQEIGKLVEDGKLGQNTVRRLQQIFGTPIDGKISNQLSVYKSICSGIMPDAIEWEDVKRGGSALVKAMQRAIEEKEDGYIGPKFIKGWQRKLGTSVDGNLSNPSQCIRALQHWANCQ